MSRDRLWDLEWKGIYLQKEYIENIYSASHETSENNHEKAENNSNDSDNNNVIHNLSTDLDKSTNWFNKKSQPTRMD